MEQTSSQHEVVVVDIRMPFMAMVWFMVQWALASIPALIILAAIVLPPSLAVFFWLAALSVSR